MGSRLRGNDDHKNNFRIKIRCTPDFYVIFHYFYGMENGFDPALLRLVWCKGLFDSEGLVTTEGDAVSVVVRGLPDGNGNVAGAKLTIGGTVFQGEVAIACHPDHNVCNANTILAITTSPGATCSSEDGTRVPVAVIPVDSYLEQKHNALLAWCGSGVCGAEIGNLSGPERIDMFTSLLTERLMRKYNQLMEIHRAGEGDWNYTLYVMTFRAMGGNRNREPFTELARAVPYTALSLERGSPLAVEALLLGSAGLLYDLDEGDPYVVALNREFDMLRRKYNIRPMRASAWQGGSFPSGSPSLRLAQLASFFTNRDFILGKVLECRSCDDLYPIFCTSASDYWSTHYNPGRFSAPRTKNIGHDKAESMGINLVVPLMFAYGKQNGEESLQARALELLEAIPCEVNSITRKWAENGAPMDNAFDSQAIIQLNNEYCVPRRCAECRIGRRALAEEFFASHGKP